MGVDSQAVVALGRGARNASLVRVRQPLSRFLVRAPDGAAASAVARLEALILEDRRGPDPGHC